MHRYRGSVIYAGAGFLRFGCAASDERLQQALDFIPKALSREGRVQAFLESRPALRLRAPYPVEGKDRP